MEYKNCDKCNGTGQFMAPTKFNDGKCSKCRATGKMAMKQDGVVYFMDREYKVGDKVHYMSTASKLAEGEVLYFYANNGSFGTPALSDGPVAISEVGLRIKTPTGKKEYYTLGRVYELQVKNNL